MMNSGEFGEEDEENVDAPFFDTESIIAATRDFSDANKLGQGGYGPVYKVLAEIFGPPYSFQQFIGLKFCIESWIQGIFPRGQEIAVKRLSSASGQGSVCLQ